ncbi:hypothetical protein Pdw03_4321 [Penicillium digitatum]|uniref:Uncharacterized protein n=1 Tax=Penicillium digitatum TaxID=36651 RepID=A0A7T7BIX2_PENDI|nr:hypothetical protein Pdw03_4321 [Penicillium digitatum]
MMYGVTKLESTYNCSAQVFPPLSERNPNSPLVGGAVPKSFFSFSLLENSPDFNTVPELICAAHMRSQN